MLGYDAYHVIYDDLSFLDYEDFHVGLRRLLCCFTKKCSFTTFIMLDYEDVHVG